MRFVPERSALLALAWAVVLVACSASEAATEGATIGDSLDVAGTQRVTLLESEVGIGGQGSRPPPEGSVYASFLFRIESLSPDARYDRFGFSATGPGRLTYPYTAGGRQPALAADRTLPAGGIAEGWVTFEVPDDFDDLAVSYVPPFAPASERITFTVRAPETAGSGG